MQFPVHGLFALLKSHVMFAEEFFQMIFVAAKIAERVRIFEREFQWLNRMVKTHETDVARDVPRGAQDGECVGRRAEADVPNHKFAGMILEPCAQPELIDVKRLGFRHRTDDRMKRLVVRERAHGANPVVQTNELVAGIGLHGLVLRE